MFYGAIFDRDLFLRLISIGEDKSSFYDKMLHNCSFSSSLEVYLSQNQTNIFYAFVRNWGKEADLESRDLSL